MLLQAAVHSATIQDRDGGGPLLKGSRSLFPFVERVFADSAYDHERVTNATKIVLEIVRRLPNQVGFAVLPRRWVVERTLAWLGRCRRLAKDWENLNRKGLTFLRLASIRLMLRKLCNPA